MQATGEYIRMSIAFSLVSLVDDRAGSARSLCSWTPTYVLMCTLHRTDETTTCTGIGRSNNSQASAESAGVAFVNQKRNWNAARRGWSYVAPVDEGVHGRAGLVGQSYIIQPTKNKSSTLISIYETIHDSYNVRWVSYGRWLVLTLRHLITPHVNIVVHSAASRKFIVQLPGSFLPSTVRPLVDWPNACFLSFTTTHSSYG